MKRYTEIVSFEIAKKLKEAGYPQNVGHDWYNTLGKLICTLPVQDDEVIASTYAEAFDWLLDKEYAVAVTWYDDDLWVGLVDYIKSGDPDATYVFQPVNDWCKAADAAIEYCLENLI